MSKSVSWHRATRLRVAVLSLALLAGASLANPITTIGTAADFAVLGLRNDIDIKSYGTATGNVGITERGKLTVSGAGIITGNITFADPVTNANCPQTGCGDHTPAATRDRVKITNAVSDAMAASSAIHAATATQTISGNLNPSGITSFASTGENNVIRISNDFNLDGSDILSLSGSANDYFYFDIGGKFNLSGAATIELSGISASHVIFNILGGGGTALNLASGSIGKGYFIAPNGNISVGGIIDGGVYGGLNQVNLASGSIVVANPGSGASGTGSGGGGNVAGIPEPSSLVLALAALLPLGAMWRRRQQQRQPTAA